MWRPLPWLTGRPFLKSPRTSTFERSMPRPVDCAMSDAVIVSEDLRSSRIIGFLASESDPSVSDDDASLPLTDGGVLIGGLYGVRHASVKLPPVKKDDPAVRLGTRRAGSVT